MIFKSMKKSRLIKKASKAEIKHKGMEAARRKLYDHLITWDGVYGEAIRSIDFATFSEYIDRLKALGLKYSKHNDYMPISSLCFFQPLTFVLGAFLYGEGSSDEMCVLVSYYFDNN